MAASPGPQQIAEVNQSNGHVSESGLRDQLRPAHELSPVNLQDLDAHKTPNLRGNDAQSVANSITMLHVGGVQQNQYPKKESISGRLHRMFSTGPKPSDGPRDRQKDENLTDSAHSSVTGGSRKVSIAVAGQGQCREAEPSTAQVKKREVTAAASSHMKRFQLLADGSHDHHLKQAKRQEKLDGHATGLDGRSEARRTQHAR